MKQIVKFVKAEKQESIEATSGDVTVKLGFGYSFNVTKDKEGKPLAEAKIVRKMCDICFIGEDGNKYARVADGICSNPIQLLPMVAITTTVGDKSYTKVDLQPDVWMGIGSKKTLKELADNLSAFYAITKKNAY